jgi:hypothetical protein
MSSALLFILKEWTRLTSECNAAMGRAHRRKHLIAGQEKIAPVGDRPSGSPLETAIIYFS